MGTLSSPSTSRRRRTGGSSGTSAGPLSTTSWAFPLLQASSSRSSPSRSPLPLLVSRWLSPLCLWWLRRFSSSDTDLPSSLIWMWPRPTRVLLLPSSCARRLLPARSCHRHPTPCDLSSPPLLVHPPPRLFRLFSTSAKKKKNKYYLFDAGNRKRRYFFQK